MELNSDKSIYVLIPKKYFSRYVLTYEILPLYLCYQINGKVFFDNKTLDVLLAQEVISDKEIILKIKREINTSFIAFSEVLEAKFLSQESLETFVERSYENYDIQELKCSVLKFSSALAEKVPVNIIPPEEVNKLDFSEHMALVDAVTGLVNEYIVHHPENNLNESIFPISPEEMLDKFLIDHKSNSLEQSIAQVFFRLCTQFNINSGWNVVDILDTFEELVGGSIRETSEFSRWLVTIRKLLNGENVQVPFTDQGNKALRSIALVLLNPLIQNLEAIKQTLKDEIGDEVYALAIKFANARTGYSYLSAEQRKKSGHLRKFLQQLNAQLHNYSGVQPESEKTVAIKTEPEIVKKDLNVTTGDKPDVLNSSWLIEEEVNEAEKVLKVKGIKPISGFNLNLLYKPNESFSLRVIDSAGPKGMSKFKGQLVLNLLSIQKELPAGCRFEVNDKGVFLALPSSWIESNDLKEKLITLMQTLKPLGLEQKSSKIK